MPPSQIASPSHASPGAHAQPTVPTRQPVSSLVPGVLPPSSSGPASLLEAAPVADVVGSTVAPVSSSLPVEHAGANTLAPSPHSPSKTKRMSDTLGDKGRPC